MLFLESIGSACNDPGLISILAIVKKILSLLQIIGPILALISLSLHLIKLMNNPDDKKGLPKVRNSAIALVALFMVPVVVNAFFGLLDDSTTLSSCWNSASNNTGGNGNYVSPYETEGNRSQIFTNPSDYQNGKKVSPSTTGGGSGTGGSSTGGGSSTYGGGSGTGDRTGTGNTSSSRVVFIGDSRTVQMYAYLAGSWTGANYSSGGVHVVGNDIFVAEGGMGLNWMKSTGVPAAQKYFTSGTAIVILMGVNDLSNASNYVNYVNSNANTWKSGGSSLYFVSVNPCSGSYSSMNSNIEKFNGIVKNGLASNVGWIDTNSQLYRVGFTATDGLHYDKTTYQTIYNYIKSKV